VNWV
jgi:cysteine-rich repeat protein